MEEEQTHKVERLVIELNKSGLSYLSNQQGSSNAFDYFKKAEKMLLAELKVEAVSAKVQSLLAVTYNNLAIYYKKTNKPKVALTYLKKALEIEALVLEDWLATASTHLNICAIYSFMNKHEQAADHAKLSIDMAEKAETTQKDRKSKDANFDKSCLSIKLAAIYNQAVEYEHLKKYEQSIAAYKQARDLAKLLERKNIQTSSEESIIRLEAQKEKHRRKILELLQKKRENEEKGNYDSMRRNKRNVKPHLEDRYNVYYEFSKKTESTGKLLPVDAARSQSTGVLKRDKNTDKNIERRKEGGIHRLNEALEGKIKT